MDYEVNEDVFLMFGLFVHQEITIHSTSQIIFNTPVNKEEVFQLALAAELEQIHIQTNLISSGPDH